MDTEEFEKGMMEVLENLKNGLYGLMGDKVQFALAIHPDHSGRDCPGAGVLTNMQSADGTIKILLMGAAFVAASSETIPEVKH